MYRCQVCRQPIPANTPAYRRVVETREREYPARAKANCFRRKGRRKVTNDHGGRGSQIVREIVVCPTCSEAGAAESTGDADAAPYDSRGPPLQRLRCGDGTME